MRTCACFDESGDTCEESEGRKRKRVAQVEDGASCPPAQADGGEEEQEEAKEEQLEDELEDIEDELREAEDSDQCNSQRDALDLLDSSDGDIGDVREDLVFDLERCENDEFEKWAKECKAQDKHVYITNIITGECSCPDRSTVGYVCKHIFRALHISGKTFLDLPRSVTD